MVFYWEDIGKTKKMVSEIKWWVNPSSPASIHPRQDITKIRQSAFWGTPSPAEEALSKVFFIYLRSSLLVRELTSRWHADPCKFLDMNMMMSSLTPFKGHRESKVIAWSCNTSAAITPFSFKLFTAAPLIYVIGRLEAHHWGSSNSGSKLKHLWCV